MGFHFVNIPIDLILKINQFLFYFQQGKRRHKGNECSYAGAEPKNYKMGQILAKLTLSKYARRKEAIYHFSQSGLLTIDIKRKQDVCVN